MVSPWATELAVTVGDVPSEKKLRLKPCTPRLPVLLTAEGAIFKV